MRRDPGSITAGSDGPLPMGARSDRERERSDRQRDAGRCGVVGLTGLDPEQLEWEHSYDRTPYENLRVLVEELPDDTPDREIVQFSFQYIAALGPGVTDRALERIRREGGE